MMKHTLSQIKLTLTVLKLVASYLMTGENANFYSTKVKIAPGWSTKCLNQQLYTPQYLPTIYRKLLKIWYIYIDIYQATQTYISGHSGHSPLRPTFYQIIPLHSRDYLKKTPIKINVATDEGNSQTMKLEQLYKVDFTGRGLKYHSG